MKRLVLYFRMVIALVVWLMWVPYVTAWTWKLFLNPAAVLEEQALGDGSVVFLVWLEKAIGIRYELEID